MTARIFLFGSLTLMISAAWLQAQDDDRERDEETLRTAELKIDGQALLDYFRSRSVSEEERKTAFALIKKMGAESFRDREKATDEIEKFGVKAISLLKQHLENPDPEVSRRCRVTLMKLEKIPSELVSAAAARMLGRLKTPGASAAILSQLPLAEDEYVAEAMRWGLTQLAVQNNQPEPVILQAIKDPVAVRRGAAAEALVRAGSKSELPRIREMMQDTDLQVRLQVAAALVVFAREKGAVPQLIELLEKLPLTAGWQAEEVLHRIAGESAPVLALDGDPGDRIRRRNAWEQWWKKNGASVDLAKLDEKPKFYGYLMVLQLNQNGGAGKVVEYAPDGKTVRWQIDGLQFPISAQVLPNQHVLIAEHNGQQVTERDQQGRIHWRKQVMQPLYCERLANGNTFIVTRNSVIETTKDGKDIFTHDRANGDIVAGARTREGHMLIATQPGQIIRLDQKGGQVRTVQAQRMYYYSHIQLLPQNRIMVTNMNSVAEIDELTGKQIWSANVSRPSCVQRLPNGNTLTSSYLTRKVVEVDRAGKVVSEHTPEVGNIPYRAFKR